MREHQDLPVLREGDQALSGAFLEVLVQRGDGIVEDERGGGRLAGDVREKRCQCDDSLLPFAQDVDGADAGIRAL